MEEPRRKKGRLYTLGLYGILGLAGAVYLGLAPVTKSTKNTQTNAREAAITEYPPPAIHLGQRRTLVEILEAPAEEGITKEQTTSDEEYLDSIFQFGSGSAFSAMPREEIERYTSFLPTQECFTAAYTARFRGFGEKTIEEIAKAVPTEDPMWGRFPEMWNKVYGLENREKTLAEVISIPTEQIIASQWTSQTRETFKEICETEWYATWFSNFYAQEVFANRPGSQEMLTYIQDRMLPLAQHMNYDFTLSRDGGNRLRDLIVQYGEAAIAEVAGKPQTTNPDEIEKGVLTLFNERRAELETQMGTNSDITFLNTLFGRYMRCTNN